MKMKDNFSYSDFINLLQSGEPFTFLRFGDGELNCIYRIFKKQTNTDNHQYFPDLALNLERILGEQNSNQTYLMGFQNFAKKHFGEQVERYYQNITWCNADILHYASIKGEFKVKQYLNNSLFIGNKEAAKLPFTYRIITKEVDAWQLVKWYKQDITKILESKPDIKRIWLSCGMMAEPLADWIAKVYPDQYQIIDSGSVFDPYANKSSRTYHDAIIKKRYTL